MLKCKECDIELPIDKSKFCSNRCRCKDKYRRNKDKYNKQSYKTQKNRRNCRKINYVNKLGGCCSNCGYNKNLSSLSFHHKYDKKFNLDTTTIGNKILREVDEEINKCDLLCMNCHIAYHNPDYTLDFYNTEYNNIEELIKKFI